MTGHAIESNVQRLEMDQEKGTEMSQTRTCHCGAGAIPHNEGDGRHCKSTQTKTSTVTTLPPHRLHDDVFEEAHATAAGAVMGARMAGKRIPAWTPDMNEAFRAAVAEAFDAGFRFGQETAR